MFSKTCFIRKNTPELRDRMKELGYEYKKLFLLGLELPHLATIGNICHDLYVDECPEECVDCQTNEMLFLAVAALRDDSDRLQWFVCTEDDNTSGKKVYKRGDFALCLRNNSSRHFGIKTWRKATVEELIEHFKDYEDN